MGLRCFFDWKKVFKDRLWISEGLTSRNRQNTNYLRDIHQIDICYNGFVDVGPPNMSRIGGGGTRNWTHFDAKNLMTKSV